MELLDKPRFKKVMLAHPTLGHATTDVIALFMFEMGKLTGMQKIEFTPCFRTGNSGLSFPVEYQRNKVVQEFRKSDCEALWFIDSDTLPSENSLELLRTPGDVVGGIYCIPQTGKDAFHKEPPLVWGLYSFPKNREKTGFHPIPVDPEPPFSLVKVDGLATGCMIITRNVLLDKRIEHSEPDSDGVPAVFRTTRFSTGKLDATDDLDFCIRARELGYNFTAHTGVRWGHLKKRNLSREYQNLVDAVQFGMDAAKALREREEFHSRPKSRIISAT